MQRGEEAKKQSNIKTMRPSIYVFKHMFIIYYLLFALFCMPVYALEFDTSLDDFVRKNYNPSKIQDDMALPALPKILSEKPQKKVSKIPQTNSIYATTKPIHKPLIKAETIPLRYQQSANISQGNYTTLKRGTKVRVKLLTDISDRSPRGTRLSFISKYPVSTTYLTLPTGTLFTGEIVDSHRTQLSGNGGLIKIRVNSVIFNDEIHPINAYVVKANSKKIFFNNIKGKRTYMRSAIKSTKPGRNFCKKMLNVTQNLASDGSSIILTPFSLGFGVLALAGNTCVSPVIALFYKGYPIRIKEGSELEIKLAQDVFIYN